MAVQSTLISAPFGRFDPVEQSHFSDHAEEEAHFVHLRREQEYQDDLAPTPRGAAGAPSIRQHMEEDLGLGIVVC
jgi:hypothetical protein